LARLRCQRFSGAISSLSLTAETGFPIRRTEHALSNGYIPEPRRPIRALAVGGTQRRQGGEVARSYPPHDFVPVGLKWSPLLCLPL
jgi:hypothetical protein